MDQSGFNGKIADKVAGEKYAEDINISEKHIEPCLKNDANDNDILCSNKKIKLSIENEEKAADPHFTSESEIRSDDPKSSNELDVVDQDSDPEKIKISDVTLASNPETGELNDFCSTLETEDKMHDDTLHSNPETGEMNDIDMDSDHEVGNRINDTNLNSNSESEDSDMVVDSIPVVRNEDYETKIDSNLETENESNLLTSNLIYDMTKSSVQDIISDPESESVEINDGGSETSSNANPIKTDLNVISQDFNRKNESTSNDISCESNSANTDPIPAYEISDIVECSNHKSETHNSEDESEDSCPKNEFGIENEDSSPKNESENFSPKNESENSSPKNESENKDSSPKNEFENSDPKDEFEIENEGSSPRNKFIVENVVSKDSSLKNESNDITLDLHQSTSTIFDYSVSNANEKDNTVQTSVHIEENEGQEQVPDHMQDNENRKESSQVVRKRIYTSSESDSSDDSVSGESCDESSMDNKDSLSLERLSDKSNSCSNEINDADAITNETQIVQQNDCSEVHRDGESCSEVSLNSSSLSQSVFRDSPGTIDELDLQTKHVTKTNDVDLELKANKVESENSNNLLYTEVSKEETGFPDAFEGSVTIGKYISVKGDFTLKSSEALIESASLIAPFLLKEPDKFPPREKEAKPEPKGFFRSSVGEFLIGLGLSRVNEWYHRDMARIKTRQMKKEGKSQHLEQEFELHQDCYLQSKRANEPFSFPFKACKVCNFATESSIVLEGHLLVPHVTQRREYQCNFCTYLHRDPREMLMHMEANHGKIGRIQPPILFYECPYCTFESNSKVKLNSHLSKCLKYFDRAINQAPPKDFEIPGLTPKPITVAVVKAYEKSISCMHRGRGRPKKIDSVPDMFNHHLNQFSTNRQIAPNQGMSMYRSIPNMPLSDGLSMQNQVIPGIRPAHSNVMGQIRPNMPPMHMPPSSQYFQVVNSSGQMLPILGNNQLVTSPSQFSFMPGTVNSGQKKTPSSNNMPFYSNLYGSGGRQQNPKLSPDLPPGMPQPPKLQGPYPVQLSKSLPSPNAPLQPSSLVVCEICDGYIKDLEQLRTHMQLIHKVKIHPKMLVSRPPLNCQKCQWRFFTDQGLERHLLGAHGLVTSNMQELANKNKDAGCCTICGRVYASKLVAHMNQVHKVTLKPAHLSYKCTVCSATFNLYRLFENHVYLVHSGASKRPSDTNNMNPSKKLARTSNSDKDLSDVDKPSKSPAEKENNAAQKKLDTKEGSEEQRLRKCEDCGIELKERSPDKRRLSRRDISYKVGKCEKCLKSHGLSISSDSRLDGSKEAKDSAKMSSSKK